MPVILLSVDANTSGATAGITSVVGNLRTLEGAIGSVTDTTSGFDAALARATTSMTVMITTIARAEAYFVSMETAIGRAADQLAGFSGSADRATGSLRALLYVVGDMSGSLDGQVAKYGLVTTAMDATTASIKAQTAAYGDLATAQALASRGGISGAIVSGTGRTVASSEVSGLERGGAVLARAGASDVGGVAGSAALAGFGPGALVGPALAAIVAGYAGYKVSGVASGFQSAEAQTGAQINNMQNARLAANDILAYTASGKSPYDATALMSGIEPLLAHQYNPNTYATGIKTVAELSGQNEAPNVGNAVNAVNQYLALLGSGAKSTAAQMADAGNYFSKLETLTTIKPGQLTPAMANVLASAIGTGLTPEQLGGAFVKIGTANSSASQDSTTLTRMITELYAKVAPQSQKLADQLGITIGPQSQYAYGGSLEAQAQAIYNATAGPNQAKDLLTLFPTSGARGGAQAFRELLAGGGTQQALGYESQLGNRAGSTQNAYLDYSMGLNQQATQEMNQFNSYLISTGSTLNQTVKPALLDLASGALHAAGVLGGILGYSGVGLQRGVSGVEMAGSFLDSHIPGGKGTLIMDALPGGILIAAVKGIVDHVGDIGNAIHDVPNYHATLPAGVAGPLLPAEHRAYIGPLPGEVPGSAVHTTTLPYNVAGPLLGTEQRASHGAPSGSSDQRFDVTLPQLAYALSGLVPLTNTVANGFGMLTTAVGTAATGLRASLGPPSNAPLNADKSTLQMMIEAGATVPRMYTQLAALKGDLLNSTYTPAQQQAIYHQESQRVYAAATGPGDQLAIQAAQMNLDAAQQMMLPPAVIKRDQDAYLAALTKFYTDTEAGTKRASDLRSVAVQGQEYGYQDRSSVLNKQLQDLDALAQAAQLQGNSGLYAKYLTQETNLKAGNAAILGLDPASVALLKAQTQASLYATNPITNQHPFFNTNQSLGPLEAGAGATLVRGGGMAADPSVVEMRLMRQEITSLKEVNQNLLQQIANNTKGSRGQAAKPTAAQHGNYGTRP